MKNTHNPKYDYHPETDDVSSNIKWLIIIAAIVFAVYLSFVVV